MTTLLLLLVATARGAVPVQLPPGESPAAWSEALALAGLIVGGPSAGANVAIRDAGSTWLLSVRDAHGQTHEVSVSPARSAAAREDIGWLAASLLESVSVPSGSPPAAPPAAPPTAPPVKPPPAVVRTPKPPPVAAPAVAEVPEPPPPALEPAPEPVAPPATATLEPVTPPEARPPPLRLSVGVASSLSLRPGASPTPAFSLDIGVLPQIPVYVGVGVAGAPAAALTRIVGDQTLSTVDVEVLVGFHPDPPVPVRLDLVAGVAWREFREADNIVAIVPFPTLEARAGFAFHLTDWAAVEPGVRLAADLRGADLTLDGGERVALSPWTVGVGVTFRSTFAVADVQSR